MLIQPLNRAAKIRLLLIVALLLIASYVKLSGFLVTPPGMHPDTAEYVNDGLRISRTGGQFPLYFDTRPEPLWRYVLAGVVLWTNAVPFANKLAGNLIGILTVAVSYRAAFELLRLWPWCSAKARILGALICASAVASTVSLQFITRQGYRAGVLTRICLGRRRRWIPDQHLYRRRRCPGCCPRITDLHGNFRTAYSTAQPAPVWYLAGWTDRVDLSTGLLFSVDS
jgi:hypothetical protein